MTEVERVREALHDDPFVTDADYGRLVAEADEADERASWAAECPGDEELRDEMIYGWQHDPSKGGGVI